MVSSIGDGVTSVLKSEAKSMPQMTTSPVAATTAVSDLKAKIERRQARVAIIGLGYVGLPLALLFTEQKIAGNGLRY